MTQKLSGKQYVVIQALLEGLSVPEAAAVADVSTRQVYRWLSDSPGFSERLADEQEQALYRAGVRLAGLIDAALSALADVLASPEARGANVKRLAAVSVIELLLRWRDAQEFEERLSALEARLS
jgi:hypothetical protein